MPNPITGVKEAATALHLGQAAHASEEAVEVGKVGKAAGAAEKEGAAAGDAAKHLDPHTALIHARLEQAALALDLVSLCPGANIPASIAAAALHLAAGDYTGSLMSL